MTECEEYTFPCKICNTRIPYYVTVEKYWEYDGDLAFKRIDPIAKQYYRAKARLAHNATHKGELDIFCKEV